MIRRALHADASDVRAFAREAKRRAVKAIDRYTFVDWGSDFACALIADQESDERAMGVGVGYVLDNNDPACWPDGARLLTIGRITLAAWGFARKDGA